MGCSLQLEKYCSLVLVFCNSVCSFYWTDLVLSIFFFFANRYMFLKVYMSVFTEVIHAGYKKLSLKC